MQLGSLLPCGWGVGGWEAGAQPLGLDLGPWRGCIPAGAGPTPPPLQRTMAQQGLTWPPTSDTSPRGMRHSGSLACPASSTNTCVKCPTLEPKT